MTSSVLTAFLLALAVSAWAVELPYFCSFEDSGLCGMEHGEGGDFNWTRHTGNTSSVGTGPYGAFNGLWYMYIETSDDPPYNRETGDKVYIQTPAIEYTGEVCIRFQCHMYGQHIGGLVVFVDTRGENSTPTFSKSGHQDTTWQRETVNVEGFKTGERVVFMAEVGDGNLSDIAIDDLHIANGACHEVSTKTTPQPLTTRPSTSWSSLTTTPAMPVLTYLTTTTTQPPSTTTARVTGQQTEKTTGLEDQLNYCVEAYSKVVDADQAFESSCETEELLFNEPRDQCLREACRRGLEVVAVRNEVCDLKLCHDGDIQLAASAGSLGWDIFVLNRTWSETLGDRPGHLDFPLWQVIVAVTGVVLAVIAFAVGIAVYLKRRKKASQAKAPNRVYYENDAALPTRPAGDVTKPADEAPYEEVGGPSSITASAVQIQMSPPRPDPEDPNPGGYEDLESYQPHVRGPYDVII